MSRNGWTLPAALTVLLLLCVAADHPTFAARVFLKDGRILQGQPVPTSGLTETPALPGPEGPLQLIVSVDDELRRTFISKRQILEIRQDDPAEVLQKFRIRQPVARSGQEVISLGPIIRIRPSDTLFDEYGRRILTVNSATGPVNIIQGITEITPVWTKVEGLSYEGGRFVWDMRIATSSIPPKTLHTILMRQIDPSSIEDRRRIAGFYLQAQRYGQAAAELERIVSDFSNNPSIQQEMAPLIQSLKQMQAKRLLDELELRREAGQHGYVYAMLQNFPTDGVAGEILQAVREMIQEYDQAKAQRDEMIEKLDALVKRIEDESQRERIAPIRAEIAAELSVDTLARMASFRLLADDDSSTPHERVALAISGWLVGSDTATRNLPVALSLFQVRALVREYLNTPVKMHRAQLLERFHSQEGATPTLVAKLIAHMKPPVETPAPPEETPGFYRLEAPGSNSVPSTPYLVQLPPEYDPLRRYPAILTLHGGGVSPEFQVDWWAGAWAEGGRRAGQATRHGCIVIAPYWAAEHQKQYRYSGREAVAVLSCLRDACRRFAIDTDRVFLTGHSMGGDAAWDMGLAHPDLWAGVIPIAAQADRYCSRYWENAKLLPMYFVAGELDGGKRAQNAGDLDRYLKLGYNATVAEFRGRGHEHFSDEILRLFDWMGRFKRDFFPKEFKTHSMRPWDSFFWWVELRELPSGPMVHPEDWPPPRGTQTLVTEASIKGSNSVYVKTGAGKVTVWLTPDMLDLEKRVNVVVNGQRITSRRPFVEPDLETLLEDVRTRSDRQHPFWVEIDSDTGRVHGRR